MNGNEFSCFSTKLFGISRFPIFFFFFFVLMFPLRTSANTCTEQQLGGPQAIGTITSPAALPPVRGGGIGIGGAAAGLGTAGLGIGGRSGGGAGSAFGLGVENTVPVS